MLFMGLLEVFIRSQCDLEDPCNRPKARVAQELEYEYDFIVIGGGSGGSVTVRKTKMNNGSLQNVHEVVRYLHFDVSIYAAFLRYTGIAIIRGIRLESSAHRSR